jgi:2-haloacid dehalogenase
MTRELERDGSARGPIRTLVFDVLGTVVDEAGSIAAELSAVVAAAGRDPQEAAVLASAWSDHLEAMFDDVVAGRAGWRSNDELRRAALLRALADQKITDLPAVAVDELALVGHRLRPWPDSPQALTTLAESYALIALSNADLAQLVDMFSAGGLRWHGVAAAGLVKSYKPDPAVYRMALDQFGLNPDETVMVAAHPWDLRAAAAHGLRTAFIARPGEGVCSPEDRFDVSADDLAHLARLLNDRPAGVRRDQ